MASVFPLRASTDPKSIEMTVPEIKKENTDDVIGATQTEAHEENHKEIRNRLVRENELSDEHHKHAYEYHWSKKERTFFEAVAKIAD